MNKSCISPTINPENEYYFCSNKIPSVKLQKEEKKK